MPPLRKMTHTTHAIESLNENPRLRTERRRGSDQQTESHLVSPNLTILHIEDDPRVARSIFRLLQLKGFNVVSAATRDMVLQLITNNRLRPDLVLTDYQLSAEVTGDQLVAEIVTYLKYKPPIIILTGVPLLQIQKAAPIADRILSKPVNSETLLSEIQDLTAATRLPIIRPVTHRAACKRQVFFDDMT